MFGGHGVRHESRHLVIERLRQRDLAVFVIALHQNAAGAGIGRQVDHAIACFTLYYGFGK